MLLKYYYYYCQVWLCSGYLMEAREEENAQVKPGDRLCRRICKTWESAGVASDRSQWKSLVAQYSIRSKKTQVQVSTPLYCPHPEELDNNCFNLHLHLHCCSIKLYLLLACIPVSQLPLQLCLPSFTSCSLHLTECVWITAEQKKKGFNSKLHNVSATISLLRKHYAEVYCNNCNILPLKRTNVVWKYI